MKIKKGDMVQVIAGKDKGAQGRVIEAYPQRDKVLVEGVNRVTKHLRAGQDNNGSTEGGRQVAEAPIHISNVAVVDPETKKPTRVGYRFETVEKDGVSTTVKVRFAKASGKEL